MNENKTILIVDDTKTNLDILLGLLEGYDILVATNGYTALKIAQEEEIDLMLLDIMMPDIDGYEVCAKLKENESTKSIPIIFITAKIDEESIEKAYDVGGVDYITKPFKPKELLARVQIQLQMRLLIKNLEFLASRDSMTGIYNRRKFFELSEKLYETTDDLFAVMLDIDEFKKINDTYGHNIGDEVIKEVVNKIKTHLTSGEIFGRIGGEEFVVLKKENQIENIKKQFEQIRQNIESIVLFTEDNQEVKITISIGISKKDTDTKNLDYLLKIADKALYKAKNSGRNNVKFNQ
jgi:diguanylate cyclase (GGDEF)-like protein